MITQAFTCTGPYAVLIMLGIKRVENRSHLPEPSRGRCGIGCSKSFNAAEYGNFVQWASQHLSESDFKLIPAWSDVCEWPGKIVGCCDYAARTESTPYHGKPREAWDEGYGCWWDLSNVVCFDRPIPCRGNVGMWKMPPELAAQVTAADALSSCEGEMVRTTDDAVRIFRAAMPIAGNNEGFFVLPLDAHGRSLSAPVMVALGDSSTTAVQPRDVFSVALKADAASVIVAHNHPSGNVTPSKADVELTEEFRKLGTAIGITLLDHLIIGANDSRSLTDLQ